MSKILAIFRSPDMTKEKYSKVQQELEKAGLGQPKARPYHCMSTHENGAVIVDQWESKEWLDKFFETLGPILTKHGVKHPKPEIYPVHDVISLGHTAAM
jgi:hypothetical protein